MKQRISNFLSLYRLPILSGILIGTSYIPFYPWALFFGFVPYWIFCIQDQRPGKVFIAGWVSQWLLTLIGFHWIAHTAHEFGHLPWVASVPVLFAFCSFANLHVPIAGYVWAKIHEKFKMTLTESGILLAALTATAENLMPMIFPWHHGYPWLWAGWQGFQFADVIGFEGLSALTILLNGLVLILWMKRADRRLFVRGGLTVVSGLILFNFAGWQYGKSLPRPDSEFRILNVQANIGNIIKYFAEQGSAKASKTITEKYFSLTREALAIDNNIDFVIWPETAFPDFLDPEHEMRFTPMKLKSFVRSIGRPLITGSYSRNSKTRQTYNSIFFVTANGQVLPESYQKTILLAFGEYFPGAQYFPFLKEIVPAISDFGRGSGPTVTRFGDVDFGSQICYEGLYTEFSRDLANQGAQVFINVTNDSWFGTTFEPYQHLYMTLSRAIEYRRPLIRSTNTGFTAAISSSGVVTELSLLHDEWTGTFNIQYRRDPKPTVFSVIGEYFSSTLTCFTLVLICLVVIKRVKERMNGRSNSEPQIP